MHQLLGKTTEKLFKGVDLQRHNFYQVLSEVKSNMKLCVYYNTIPLRDW